MKTLRDNLKAVARRVATMPGRALVVLGVIGCTSLLGPEAHASEALFLKVIAASSPPSAAIHLCQQYSWVCADKRSVSHSDQRELQIINQVNRKVNTSTREVGDRRQYRTRDLWTLPTSMGGDCEDFALLKKKELIGAGVDPNKLLIATVLDERRNGHAVLVYRSSHGDLILDNQTNRIKLWSATRYLFLRMQDPNQPRRWVIVSSRS